MSACHGGFQTRTQMGQAGSATGGLLVTLIRAVPGERRRLKPDQVGRGEKGNVTRRRQQLWTIEMMTSITRNDQHALKQDVL